MYGINYNGLRRRLLYDELVNYIETDPNKIRYPNRNATFTEQSHYLKQIGGVDFIAMEEQQTRLQQEQMKQALLRQESAKKGTTHIMDRATQTIMDRATQTRPTPIAIGGGLSSIGGNSDSDGEESSISSVSKLIDKQLEEMHKRDEEKSQEVTRRSSEFLESIYSNSLARLGIVGDASKEEVEADPRQALRGYKGLDESMQSEENEDLEQWIEDIFVKGGKKLGQDTIKK